MALLLFIDTSYSHTHIALCSEEAILENIIHSTPNEQAKELNNLIADAIAKQKISLSDVDAFILNGGPGSYTGLRVGIGVAKGYCFALDKPMMLFNKLDLLAVDQCDVAIVLKARNLEGFAFAREKGETTLKAEHIFYESFDWEHFGNSPIITDDESILEKMNTSTALSSQILNIEYWNKIAQIRFLEGNFDSAAYAEPFYLKSAFTTRSTKKLI